MTFPVILTLVLAPCLGAAILLLVRRLTAPGTISECDPDWLANFSTATYRPMQRLLSDTDLKYLASQPGITASTVKQLRRERRRIFRAYLRNLVPRFPSVAPRCSNDAVVRHRRSSGSRSSSGPAAGYFYMGRC